MSTTPSRYSTVAIVLHWTIAALIIGNIAAAWTFANMPKGLAQYNVVQLHKSIGITVLALSLVRIAWRLGHKPPALPPMPAWQKGLAHAVHAGLYAIMLFMPLTGWVMASASKRNLPTMIFGAFQLPFIAPIHNLEPQTKAIWDDVASGGHEILAKLAYVLIVLHVGAALKHHLVDRDSVLVRMAPFLGGRSVKGA
ncbi:MAG: cytochrome b [Pseudomonadota bacterium]